MNPDLNHLGDLLTASYVSFGVKVDGGGFVIVNGRPVPVDPWGPLYNLGAALAVHHAAGLIQDLGARQELQRVALTVAEGQLQQLRKLLPQ